MTVSTFLTRRLGGHDEPPAGTGVRASRRLILITGAVVVVGALLAWLVFFSSVFGARTIKVAGLRVLTTQQVTRAAAISPGSPLIRLDTGAVERRIEELPDVASARVSTSYPSTVTITVVERVPVGVVAVSNGFVLVDKMGDQYRSVPTRPAGLPLFVVPPGTSAKDTGGAVATVAVALGTHLRAEITSIQALDPNAISLLLSNGVVVAWGSAAQNDLKAKVLGALLSQRGQHQIDVSDPSAPFTR